MSHQKWCEQEDGAAMGLNHKNKKRSQPKILTKLQHLPKMKAKQSPFFPQKTKGEKIYRKKERKRGGKGFVSCRPKIQEMFKKVLQKENVETRVDTKERRHQKW